ncbi:uncharacterized protein FSUBG_13588 [Fusarium subglutinans]|uniref:Uncharacterized protein n=1 Tax=Gibberella subglutinans TaxID=42677 RepID=A0A8H5KTG4_GIBSU|nr:uncharacterized protein FSUBG_13588 [Fusarium subglutinans]KAF5579582.1 hypothetical protein FSUBG_13588 [Fusarium subglutinans]
MSSYDIADLSAVKNCSHLKPDITQELYHVVLWLTTSTTSCLRSIPTLAIPNNSEDPGVAVMVEGLHPGLSLLPVGFHPTVRPQIITNVFVCQAAEPETFAAEAPVVKNTVFTDVTKRELQSIEPGVGSEARRTGSFAATVLHVIGIDEAENITASLQGCLYHAHVNPSRSQAVLGHHFEPCRQQAVHSGNYFAGGNFASTMRPTLHCDTFARAGKFRILNSMAARWCATRRPSRRKGECAQRGRVVFRTARSEVRTSWTSQHQGFSAWIRWDSAEELRGFRNSFGFDDAGALCILQFNSRASAPLVAGVYLVNLTLPRESNFNLTNRRLRLLKYVTSMHIAHAFTAVGRKLWSVTPTSLLLSITVSSSNASWVRASHLPQ